MQDFTESRINGLRYAFKRGLLASSPLLVGIHGKAGTLYVLNAFSSTYPKDASIMYFEAPLADKLGGFSWWEFDPTGEDAGAQWDKALSPTNHLLAAISAAEHKEGLNPRKRLGVGFSQGGGLLSVALQIQPAFFKKVALLASFAVKSPPVVDLSPVKILWAHGEIDERISLAVAIRGAEYLQERGAQLEFVTDPVGHKVGSRGMRALKEFLATMSDPDLLPPQFGVP